MRVISLSPHNTMLMLLSGSCSFFCQSLLLNIKVQQSEYKHFLFLTKTKRKEEKQYRLNPALENKTSAYIQWYLMVRRNTAVEPKVCRLIHPSITAYSVQGHNCFIEPLPAWIRGESPGSDTAETYKQIHTYIHTSGQFGLSGSPNLDVFRQAVHALSNRNSWRPVQREPLRWSTRRVTWFSVR